MTPGHRVSHHPRRRGAIRCIECAREVKEKKHTNARMRTCRLYACKQTHTHMREHKATHELTQSKAGVQPETDPQANVSDGEHHLHLVGQRDTEIISENTDNPYICLSMCLHVCLSVCPSGGQSVCLTMSVVFAYVSVHASVGVAAYVSVVVSGVVYVSVVVSGAASGSVSASAVVSHDR